MSRIVDQVLEYHIGIPLKDIHPHMIFDEMGVDSLDCVEICMDIEEKFGIIILDAELDTIKKVQDLYDLVDKKQAEKPVNSHLLPKKENT